MKSHPSPLKSVAIFGSGFNPPTVGHLDLIHCLLQGHPHSFDLIRLIPTGCSTLKSAEDYADKEDRLQMLKLLLETELSAAERKKIIIETLEIKKKESSKTVDTLRELKSNYHHQEHYTLICGYDHLLLMPQWTYWQELKDLCDLMFFPREDVNIADAPTLDSLKKILQAELEVEIILNDHSKMEPFQHLLAYKNLRLTVDPAVNISLSSGTKIRQHYKKSISRPNGISEIIHAYILKHGCYQ